MSLHRTSRFGFGQGYLSARIRFQLIACLLMGFAPALWAQTTPEAERLADAILQSGFPTSGAWDEEAGTELGGLDAAWYGTAKGDYFRFVRARVDAVLATTTNTAATPFENGLLGRQLLLLYRVTQAPKYYTAAAAIRAQLASTCDAVGSRIQVCTTEPFLAEYAAVFQEPQEFANLTRDLTQWEHDARWPAKKDEASERPDKSIAWLAASLVDALPYYPETDPGRSELIASLNRIAAAAAQHQNKSTGLFERSGEAPHQPLHPSQTSLLAYAMAKGTRLGYLPAEDARLALKAWKAIEKSYLSAPSDQEPRPGSGVLLVAAAELDLVSTATFARGQTVLLDAWYNSQERKNAAGQMESFHYKWSDMSDPGYALFGHMFRSYGAATETLDTAPTQESLRKAQYYIVVSPDIPVKNPNPHYMTEHDAQEIAAWVKDGGILVLMENDPPNADIAHLNLLADQFGIHFDDVLHHHIIGEQVEDGRIPVDGNGPLFHHAHTLYMKDTCAISLREPAVALLRDRGDVVMASAKYGRGTVFAAVDPWLYNEYTDGRKNPRIYSQFDNFAGGRELVQWLLQQHPH